MPAGPLASTGRSSYAARLSRGAYGLEARHHWFLEQAVKGDIMLAKDIMTREVITVRPQTPLEDVSTLLVQHRISATPVIDTHGKVLGIVSEADIMSKKGKQARAIMSKRVVSVAEDASVSEIASTMITNCVNRVPVMRGDQMVGIVSRADIVRAIALGEHVAHHSPIYDL